MRTLIAWTWTLAVGAGAVGTAAGQGTAPAPKRAPAPAQAAPKAAGKVAAPAPRDPEAVKAQQLAFEKARQEMNSLLAEWEAQSKKVLSLDVEFRRVDKLGPAWGDAYYQGRAMLKSPDLACLEFRKYKVDDNGKPLVPKQLEANPDERIICTGKEVLQFKWDEKAIYIYPLDKEVRQKALQEGPLPFLFNMKAAEAKRRYSMTLLEQNDKEYTIAIVPNEEIDKENFTKAFLKLNKTTFLPNKLWLYPIAKQEVQIFEFEGIQPNRPLDNAFFSPSTKIEGWKVYHNPGGDGPRPALAPGADGGATRVQAAPAPAQPRRQAQQPAMRPAPR